MHLVIGFEGGVGKAPSCSAGERNALIVFKETSASFAKSAMKAKDAYSLEAP